MVDSIRKPLVGVFVAKTIINRLHKQEQIFAIKSLWDANKQAGTTLYFFSINDVDLENQMITGTLYNKTNKKWQTKKFPFPDVIYNRRSEGNYRVARFRLLVKDLKVRTINPINDFNKWELFRNLYNDPEMRDYLPHTIIFHEENDLWYMLNRCRTVYLKAVIGRYSRQVMRVRQLENGSFAYSFVDNQLRLKETESWEQLLKTVQSFFKGKNFIIQEGINVFNIDDRNVDIRAELQRNGKGCLEIVAISARLAAPQSPVSSTRAGATIYKFTDFFKINLNYSKAESKKLLSRVDAFLEKVYLSVEKTYGSFGEIGIDFALDKNLNLWLIECNTKSAKIALFMSYDQQVINRAFLNPLEYAKYIAGSGS